MSRSYNFVPFDSDSKAVFGIFLLNKVSWVSIIMHDLLSLLKTGVYKKHLFYISFVRHCFSALKKPPPLRESITDPLNHRLSMRHSNF